MLQMQLKIFSKVVPQIFSSGLSACYSINNRLSPCNYFHLRCVSTSFSSTAVGTVSPYQPSLPF